MKRYSREVKEEVVGKVRSGRKITDLAKEHGINDMTIRSWVERDTESGAGPILEISRLKRENEALLKLIGQLTYESETQKKNQRRERR